MKRAASLTVNWQRIRCWYQSPDTKLGDKCPQRGLARTHWKIDECVFQLVQSKAISIPDEVRIYTQSWQTSRYQLSVLQPAGGSEQLQKALCPPTYTQLDASGSSISVTDGANPPRLPSSPNNVDGGVTQSLTTSSMEDIRGELSVPRHLSSPPIPVMATTAASTSVTYPRTPTVCW